MDLKKELFALISKALYEFNPTIITTNKICDIFFNGKGDDSENREAICLVLEEYADACILREQIENLFIE